MTIAGDTIRDALATSRRTQKWLADQLTIDASQVSRWVRGTVTITQPQAERIDELLGTNLAHILAADRTSTSTGYELFLATPMASMPGQEYEKKRDDIVHLHHVLSQTVGRVYWAGSSVATSNDFEAPDIATKKNLAALKASQYFLYVQVTQSPIASSALIELGVALALKKPTIVFAPSVSALPYMMTGFGAVAEQLSFLPRFRLYDVSSWSEAARLIERHGPEMFE